MSLLSLELRRRRRLLTYLYKIKLHTTCDLSSINNRKIVTDNKIIFDISNDVRLDNRIFLSNTLYV